MQAILSGKFNLVEESLEEDDFLDPDFEPEIDPEDDDDDLAEEAAVADTFTGKIAVMNITGPIMHYGGPCNYGAQEYAARIRAYADDGSIAACIIRTDSPGGQAEGIQTLADAVQYFKSKKPILGFINDGKAASGGVWSIVNSTEIYASHKTCRVGSVGAMATIMDIRKALEANGISQLIFYAPQSQDKNKDYTDAIDGKPAALIAELKFICGHFIDGVSEARAGKLKNNSWNTGKMFFAEEATNIGLIDGIMSFEDVVKRAGALASQTQQSNSQQQNSMKLFGSDFPKLNALKAVSASDISAEQLAEVNSELEAAGLGNLAVVTTAHVEEANTTADAATAALASINSVLGAGNEKTNLVEAVNALKADRDSWKVKAETYGDQPGEMPTKPVTKQSSGGGEQLDNKKPSFETSFDAEAAEYLKD